jgi:hypothetical protein
MKIAICTPVYSTVVPDYASSLARMIHWTDNAKIVLNKKAVKPQIEVFMAYNSVLPVGRNELAKRAIEWGADYLLLIDSDMSFPREALLRLLSLNLQVVGVNYPRRNPPPRPTALGLEGQDLWTTQADADQMKVEEVQSLGLGFCLIQAGVLSTLRKQTYELPVPLFNIDLLDEGVRYNGEDFWFFRRVRAAGIPVHVDHHLSWGIGHWTFRPLRNDEG